MEHEVVVRVGMVESKMRAVLLVLLLSSSSSSRVFPSRYALASKQKSPVRSAFASFFLFPRKQSFIHPNPSSHNLPISCALLIGSVWERS